MLLRRRLHEVISVVPCSPRLRVIALTRPYHHHVWQLDRRGQMLLIFKSDLLETRGAALFHTFRCDLRIFNYKLIPELDRCGIPCRLVHMVRAPLKEVVVVLLLALR